MKDLQEENEMIERDGLAIQPKTLSSPYSFEVTRGYSLTVLHLYHKVLSYINEYSMHAKLLKHGNRPLEQLSSMENIPSHSAEVSLRIPLLLFHFILTA